MRAVDIGIRHHHDAVVPETGRVELVALGERDTRTKSSKGTKQNEAKNTDSRQGKRSIRGDTAAEGHRREGGNDGIVAVARFIEKGWRSVEKKVPTRCSTECLDN